METEELNRSILSIDAKSQSEENLPQPLSPPKSPARVSFKSETTSIQKTSPAKSKVTDYNDKAMMIIEPVKESDERSDSGSEPKGPSEPDSPEREPYKTSTNPSNIISPMTSSVVTSQDISSSEQEQYLTTTPERQTSNNCPPNARNKISFSTILETNSGQTSPDSVEPRKKRPFKSILSPTKLSSESIQQQVDLELTPLIPVPPQVQRKQDSKAANGPMRHRSKTVRWSKNRSNSMFDNPRVFPKFIPEDPEKPHLHPRWKEKQRHEKVRKWIKHILSQISNKKQWSGPTYFSELNEQKFSKWTTMMHIVFSDPMHDGLRRIMNARDKNKIEIQEQARIKAIRDRRQSNVNIVELLKNSSSMDSKMRHKLLKDGKSSSFMGMDSPRSKQSSDVVASEIEKEKIKDLIKDEHRSSEQITKEVALKLSGTNFNPARRGGVMQKKIEDITAKMGEVRKYNDTPQGKLDNSSLNKFGLFTRSYKEKVQLAQHANRGGNKVAKAFRPPGAPRQVEPWEGFEKLAGKPKEGQIVRDGHLPKFSAMIDELEQISIDWLGYSTFVEAMHEVRKIYLKEFKEQRMMSRSVTDFGFNSYDSSYEQAEMEKLSEDARKKQERMSTAALRRERRLEKRNKQIDDASVLNHYIHSPGCTTHMKNKERKIWESTPAERARRAALGYKSKRKINADLPVFGQMFDLMKCFNQQNMKIEESIIGCEQIVEMDSQTDSQHEPRFYDTLDAKIPDFINQESRAEVRTPTKHDSNQLSIRQWEGEAKHSSATMIDDNVKAQLHYRTDLNSPANLKDSVRGSSQFKQSHEYGIEDETAGDSQVTTSSTTRGAKKICVTDNLFNHSQTLGFKIDSILKRKTSVQESGQFDRLQNLSGKRNLSPIQCKSLLDKIGKHSSIDYALHDVLQDKKPKPVGGNSQKVSVVKLKKRRHQSTGRASFNHQDSSTQQLYAAQQFAFSPPLDAIDVSLTQRRGVQSHADYPKNLTAVQSTTSKKSKKQRHTQLGQKPLHVMVNDPSESFAAIKVQEEGEVETPQLLPQLVVNKVRTKPGPFLTAESKDYDHYETSTIGQLPGESEDGKSLLGTRRTSRTHKIPLLDSIQMLHTADNTKAITTTYFSSRKKSKKPVRLEKLMQTLDPVNGYKSTGDPSSTIKKKQICDVFASCRVVNCSPNQPLLAKTLTYDSSAKHKKLVKMSPKQSKKVTSEDYLPTYKVVKKKRSPTVDGSCLSHTPSTATRKKCVKVSMN